MERQAESLAPYGLPMPQGASVFRLPPRPEQYSDPRKSSYKGASRVAFPTRLTSVPPAMQESRKENSSPGPVFRGRATVPEGVCFDRTGSGSAARIGTGPHTEKTARPAAETRFERMSEHWSCQLFPVTAGPLFATGSSACFERMGEHWSCHCFFTAIQRDMAGRDQRPGRRYRQFRRPQSERGLHCTRVSCFPKRINRRCRMNSPVGRRQWPSHRNQSRAMRDTR
jgi:hypothetical protein